MPRKKIKGKILVVDDYANWRDLLTTLLQEEGHDVRAVSGFNAAIKASKDSEFDVILLDVRLVDTQKYNVQGIEFLKYMKKKSRNVGVIMLTGYPSKEHKELILNFYEADAYLPKVSDAEDFAKGFTIDELCNLVNDLIENKRNSDLS